MKSTLIPISALLVSVALLLTSNGLLGVLLPLRAVDAGFSAIDIGVMGTAYFIGFVAGCLIAPRLIARVGHIRTFAAIVSVVCSMTLLHGLSEIKSVWWIARGLTGLCFAASYIVIESWLNDKATNENRGFVFSVYTIISLTVITLGQFFVSFVDIHGFMLFAVAAIFISIAILPVALSIAQAPNAPAVVHVRISYLYTRSHEAIVACLGVGMVNGSFWTLAPVYAQSFSGDVRTAAYFMCVSVISGALGQWPLGRLSDRFDRRRVIAASIVGAFLGAIVLIFMQPNHGIYFYLSAAIFGAFAFPLYALCAALLNDFVDKDGYVEAASGLLLVYSVGAIFGPLMASTLIRNFGSPSLFGYFAGVYVVIGGYVIRGINRSPFPVAVADTNFTDALIMSSIKADIDPLSQDAQNLTED